MTVIINGNHDLERAMYLNIERASSYGETFSIDKHK